jgi:hypothetical protein
MASEAASLNDLVKDGIKVTPEMIAAGIYEARQHALGAPLEDLVHNVFVAMLVEQQASQPPLPSD